MDVCECKKVVKLVMMMATLDVIGDVDIMRFAGVLSSAAFGSDYWFSVEAMMYSYPFDE